MRRSTAMLAACLLVAGCNAAAPSTPATSSTGTGVAASPVRNSAAPTALARSTLPPPPTAWNPSLKVQAFDPVGLLYAFGSLWVGEHHGGKLLRVDARSGKVMAEFDGLGAGAQLLFAGAGLVWVPTAVQLEAIDPTSNKVVKDIDGSFSFDGVVAGGHIWIGNHYDKLLEIDPATGKTLATISSGSPGEQYGEGCLNSVTFAGGAIWWSVNDLAAIFEVNPENATVTGRIQGVGESFLAAAGNQVWAKSNDGMLRVIDPATASVVSTSSIEDPAPDQCGGAIAFDGATLWLIADGNYDDIYRYDVTTGKVTGFFDPGDTDLQDVAVDANHSVWLNFYDSGYVDRYDLPAP